MAIYYSPSKNSFYDDAIPAFARMIWEVDEAAKKGILSDLSEREMDLGTPEGEESDDAKGARMAALDNLHQERLDLLQNPPMCAVPNKDCRLPEDAAEISAQLHALCMEGQADGLKIVAGTDGRPTLDERTRSAEDVLLAVRSERDRALAASDWTQLPDALAAAKRKAWADHRKRLRALPQRVEEAIAKGTAPDEAADLVFRNIDVARDAALQKAGA